MQNDQLLAAVDLGSNSFRLEIGRIEQGQFCRSHYLKETIRQGSGLDGDSNLTADAMQRGWDCLERFGRQLISLAPHEVRAVATQTLREARNRDDFLKPASELLGFPIEVITGLEEARLIYQGVAQSLPDSRESRLVIDIGGRSTELILGTGHQTTHMASYPVGSVAWSMQFFPDGQLSGPSFQAAEEAAKAVLADAPALYASAHWELAFGSAGTVNAVGDVLSAAQWPTGYLSREGLDWLLDKLLVAKTTDQLNLPGMREDRKAIIGGGVSVLRALFELLGIRRLDQTNGGLRHGLLAELASTAKHGALNRPH